VAVRSTLLVTTTGGRQERSTTARLYRWNPVTAYAHDAGTHRGPRLSVRDTMSRELINPDVDPAFHGIYNRLTDRLATVYGVDSDGDTGGDSAASTRDIVVPGGEGILGLEAAIASLVEPGPRCCVSRMASTATVSPTSSRTTAARRRWFRQTTTTTPPARGVGVGPRGRRPRVRPRDDGSLRNADRDAQRPRARARPPR